MKGDGLLSPFVTQELQLIIIVISLTSEELLLHQNAVITGHRLELHYLCKCDNYTMILSVMPFLPQVIAAITCRAGSIYNNYSTIICETFKLQIGAQHRKVLHSHAVISYGIIYTKELVISSCITS